MGALAGFTVYNLFQKYSLENLIDLVRKWRLGDFK